MRHLARIAAGVLLAWWVVLNGAPYMGPFDNLFQCNSAAADINHSRPLGSRGWATCEWKVY
jgi:hypothetical protein